MSRFDRPEQPAPIPFSRAALGRTRLPIVIALGLAVGARAVYPPAPDAADAASLVAEAPAAVLPARAQLRPAARPSLPSGFALAVQPITLTPLPVPSGG